MDCVLDREEKRTCVGALWSLSLRHFELVWSIVRSVYSRKFRSSVQHLCSAFCVIVYDAVFLQKADAVGDIFRYFIFRIIYLVCWSSVLSYWSERTYLCLSQFYIF